MASQEDTGWKPIEDISGDGVSHASGRVHLDKATEKEPCYACRAFEKDPYDDYKLLRYCLDRGCVLDENGLVVTPIAKDYPGRKPMRLNLHDFGWCRSDCRLVMVNAHCELWRETRFREEMASRVGRRR